ncbi:hypothetical protein [Streptomyces sp. NPDC086023]|uniref:hypothetical protein n=1 Tax=Streptomyces sp. NPDC086023 TaxID=3365746 RepID=UPI0037CD0761
MGTDLGGALRRRVWLAVVGLACVGVVSGCAWGPDESVRYLESYSEHRPLRVVGYPSAGSLQVTQQVVWALGDGESEALAEMTAEEERGSDARKTAANWVGAFGKGARGRVTAEFYDEGSQRQLVVLYFHDTGQVKGINVRVTNEEGAADGWRVSLDESDPAEVRAVPEWVPKEPGGLGSTILP